MSNSFRLFYFENENSLNIKNVSKLPMPDYVGNFLMAVKNVVNQKLSNQDNIQETRGQSFKDRGFPPMSKAGVDFLSATPSETRKGLDRNALAQAYQWLVGPGLYEALTKRKKLAELATQSLRKEMGDQFDKVFVDTSGKPLGEITEEMLFHPAALKRFPQLAQWLSKTNYDLEPTEPMQLFYGRTEKKGGKPMMLEVTLQEVNDFVDHLNSQVKQQFGVDKLFDKLSFAGPNGFIHWVEDGDWAQSEKLGVEDPLKPWTTTHGISLHNPKMLTNGNDVVYVFGDGNIQTPMMNWINAVKTLSRDTARLVSDSIGNTKNVLLNNLDTANLDQSQLQRLEDILSIVEKGGYQPLSGGTLSTNLGISKDTKEYTFDDPEKFLAHAALVRLAIQIKANINDSIKTDLDNGLDMNQAVDNALQKYGNFIETKDKKAYIRNNVWMGKEEYTPETHAKKMKQNRITGDDIKTYQNVFGVADSQLENALKSGVYKFTRKGGGGRASWTSMDALLNQGFAFLKNHSGMIQELLPNLPADLVNQDNLQQYVKELKSEDMEFEKFPFVSMKSAYKLGKHYGGYRELNPEELNDLKRQGWKFELRSPRTSQGEEDTEGFLVGIQDQPDGSQKHARIPVWRSQGSDNWMILDKDAGSVGLSYKSDIPVFTPTQNVRFPHIGYNMNKNLITNQNKLMDSLENNPSEFGYGLPGTPESFDKHAKSIGKSFKHRDSDWENIVSQVKGGMTMNAHSLQHIKYGDILKNADTISNASHALGQPLPEFPNIQDVNDRKFWINRMQNIVSAGDNPKVVNAGKDFSVNTWSNQDPNTLPLQVNNAFLYAGLIERGERAKKYASLGIDTKVFRMGAKVDKKTGDELTTDFSAEDDKRTDMPLDTGKQNVKSTFAPSRLYGLTKGNEIQGGVADLAKRAGINTAKINRDKGVTDTGRYNSAYQEVLDDIESKGNPHAMAIHLRPALARLGQQQQSNVVPMMQYGILDASIDAGLSMLSNMANNLNDKVNLDQAVDLTNTLLRSFAKPETKKLINFSIDNAVKDVLGDKLHMVMLALRAKMTQSQTNVQPSVAPKTQPTEPQGNKPNLNMNTLSQMLAQRKAQNKPETQKEHHIKEIYKRVRTNYNKTWK